MDDGGPAFGGKVFRPITVKGTGETQMVEFDSPGLSIRDWFAGMALTGILASGRIDHTTDKAIQAYIYADRMLAARSAAIAAKEKP